MWELERVVGHVYLSSLSLRGCTSLNAQWAKQIIYTGGPSKCLINKRQHLTSSFEKPLCSQVLFKYLIRYTLFFFFKAFWWMYSSLTCTHSRNEAELSTVVWRAALGVDCAALGVDGGRLIAGCDVQIFNDSLSVSERVANKQKTPLRSCIVVVLAIEHVQRSEGRCIQADVKRATKWQKKNCIIHIIHPSQACFWSSSTFFFLFRHGNTTASEKGRPGREIWSKQ